MPVSQSTDPLFVVLGSTGNLGRSVIDAIAASESASFRVRAITRDASGRKGKDLVQLGAKVVAADVNDVETLKKAFEGASYVYGLTITDYKEFPHHKNVSLAAALWVLLCQLTSSSPLPLNQPRRSSRAKLRLTQLSQPE